MIIKVTNSGDSENKRGTLRWAINQANQSTDKINTIEISKHVMKIKLESELVIKSNIEIIAFNLIIEASGKFSSPVVSRHFHVVNTTKSDLLVISSEEGKIILENGSDALDGLGGGSILVEQANHKTILKNVIIERSSAVTGGAIKTSGSIYMRTTVLKKNRALTQGGGIWSSGSVEMSDSAVDENYVEQVSNSNFAGGINIDAGDIIMSNSSVNRNHVSYSLETQIGGFAGGINVGSGSIYMSGSTVNDNQAYCSAGIQMGSGDVNIMNSSSVSYNKSFISGYDCGGGGIVITAGNVSLQNSLITGNETKGMYSGSIVSFVGNVNVSNSVISYNINRGPGGAIASNFNSSVTVNDSKIFGNIAGSLGGAIVNFSGSLGGISINNSKISYNVLTNSQLVGQTIDAFLSVVTGYSSRMMSTISSNTGSASTLKAALENIQALAQETSNALSNLSGLPLKQIKYLTGGGAIATLLTCPITISGNSDIVYNFASHYVSSANKNFTGYGGAIFAPNSAVSIFQSHISNNKSSTGGAALYTGSSLTIESSSVNENKTIYNNYVPESTEYNGTIYCGSTANLSIVNSSVCANRVLNKGGAIYYETSDTPGVISLMVSQITCNRAKNGGGLYLNEDNLIQIDSVVVDNVPNNVITI